MNTATNLDDSSHENPWKVRPAKIQSIQHEIENVKTLSMQLAENGIDYSYEFSPGQFNMLYLPGAGESAISLSGDPENKNSLDHTIRIAGNVTRGICNLKVGDTIGLRGPFGRGWPMKECSGRDIVMVTGGIGLPPLRPVIYYLLKNRQRYGQLHLLYGARSPDSLLFCDSYSKWSQGGLNILQTVDRSSPGWAGSVGVVTLLLERLSSFDPANTVLFSCGPEVMMRFVARTALSKGLTASQIWISTERNMNCAIGLCGHCQLGGSFICKDGPVFRFDEMAPYLHIHGF